MTILIITHSQDNECIDRVMEAILAYHGKSCFRFNSDRFPTEIHLDVYYSGKEERHVITHGNQHVNLNEVTSVWYRRVAIGAKIPETMNSQLRDASLGESRATFQGMLASIRGFHLDPLVNVRRAENKQLQLQVAADLGLNIPRTLISNNPATVRKFAAECNNKIVTKTLSSFAIYNSKGQDQVVFTNPVTSEDLENLDGLQFCPMTFQENLPKALELRVTIVGNQIFAAAVDSQAMKEAESDWRKKGLALMNSWHEYQLPEDVETKLLQLMRYFGLNYGAIDIILTPDGKYYFLEVNPVGEFFWLERNPGFQISQAIAKLLIN
jgi:MvdD family ATP-grasp ribosomal peptide maturase